MIKKCFIDLETTGTDHKLNGIIQIAGIIEIDGEEKERFNLFCQPFPADKINPEALEANGITMKDIESYPGHQAAFLDLKRALCRYVKPFDKLDKYFFYGYNARFDNDFLRAFFAKHEDKYFGSWFWNPPIDIMSLAIEHLLLERSSMINFKLVTVLHEMGIEVDDSKLHDGLYDIELTRTLYQRLTCPQI